MRFRGVALVLLGLMFAAGCGGASAVPASDSGLAAALPRRFVPSNARLRRALVRASDLPERWTPLPVAVPVPVLCDGAPALARLAHAPTVVFSPGVYVPVIANALVASSRRETRAWFGAIVRRVDACDAEQPAPRIGDDSLAFRVRGHDAQLGATTTDVIVVRRGPVLTVVFGVAGSIAGVGSGTVPAGVLERAARASVERVDAMLTTAIPVA